MKIKLIVAMSENGIIGNAGGIPWKLPEEMKHFKETTMGHIVVMGFKTWQSIIPYNKTHSLSGRQNIVLTKDAENAKQCNITYNHNSKLKFQTECLKRDLDLIFQFNYNLTHTDDPRKEINAFIIGGAQIYKYYLDNDLVDELILTKVKMKLNGDTKLEIKDLDKNWTLLSIDDRKYFDILHYQRSK